MLAIAALAALSAVRGVAPARSAFNRGAHAAVRMGPPAAPGLVLAPAETASFDDLVVGGACVKRFLTDEGESWLMWYSARDDGFDKEVVPLASGQIGLATSTDGVSWKREGPVLRENKDDWFWFDTTHVGIGDVQVMSSEAQRTGGVSMYWCYYFGGDASRPDENAPKGGSLCIGLAISSDGRHWGRMEGEHPNGAVLAPGEEGEFDASLVGWPQVIMLEEGKYVLYYHTLDPATRTYTVAAATSTDGVKFVKVGPILGPSEAGRFDARGAGARHVIPSPEGSPGRYLMFYEAIDGEGRHSIGLAHSDDGLKWERAGDRPIFEPSTEPGAWDSGAVGRPNLVALDGGGYRMYYYAQSGSGAAVQQEACGIGMAENDGSDWWTWTRSAGSPNPRG